MSSNDNPEDESNEFELYLQHSSMANELPTELVTRPVPFVALTGLDIVHNAVHKTIWDAFSADRRADRAPIAFKVLPGDHEYPSCKTKRSTYEFYIPKGILKTNWLNKHLNLVPSVVVVFYDLDWDDPMWIEKHVECSAKLKVARSSLQNRNTKVAVVLIQKNPPLPPDEDQLAKHRASLLCSACDLSHSALFVLPHSDHLFGYTVKLENAFYELAINYYHHEARRIKAHKDTLTKITHQLLFVRHQFKIAFMNELKQDINVALRHYRQAYANLMEVRIHDTNVLEIKIVAGFINYKICKLCFYLGIPLDAISQFRRHIDIFKNRIGNQDLAFEHSAWMSKQFSIFGDLFDEAIKQGLTAIQTQHPGFYYQQAANHAINRKELSKTISLNNASYPSPDPLENLATIEYFGQRPWRIGNQSMDPLDQQREKAGILASQLKERQVDQSWVIIPLLGNAVFQFKKYNCPRMKRHLMVQMGEEYFHAKEYTKALTLLMRITWDYRNDRWWPLLTHILVIALQCAYLVGNIQEYINISLELLGRDIKVSSKDKHRIQANLIRTMCNECPEAEPGCSSDMVDLATQKWDALTSTQQEPLIFSVSMQNIVQFVECKASFLKEEFTADSPVILRVYLRATCQFPIRFSKLSVLLSNQSYNKHCILTDPKGIANTEEAEGELLLFPWQTKMITFTFLALPEDGDKNLEINSVALELGCETTRCVVLHWSGGGTDNSHHSKKIHHDDIVDASKINFDQLTICSAPKIKPREANLQINIEHDDPALTNEFFLLKLTITNNEDSQITNMKLSVGLKDKQEVVLDQTTHFSINSPKLEDKIVVRILNISLDDMESKEEIVKKVYVKCMQVGTRILFVKATYHVTVTVAQEKLKCTCVTEETITLQTVKPFDVSSKLLSLMFENIDKVHSQDPFLLVTDIKCISSWPINIKDSHLQLPNNVLRIDGLQQSQISDVSLKTNDCASECFCLNIPNPEQTVVSMGTYTIEWKRVSDDEDNVYVNTTLTLPTVHISSIPLHIEVDLPSHGYVRTPMAVSYTLHNCTIYVEDFRVMMESSDSFMFAGHKELHIRISPGNKYEFIYNLYPLVAGHVALPRFHIIMYRHPEVTDDVVQKMIPSHIFIMPHSKSLDSYIIPT